MRHHFLTILLVMSFFMEIISAQATITVVSYWRLGEQDPAGVASHFVPSSTTDAVGTNNLALSGATGYAQTSSLAAQAHTASAYSLEFFDGANGYGYCPVVTTAADQFGIEAWINPDSINTNGQIVAYNGSTANSGWGIIIDSTGHWGALFGGVVSFTSTLAATNTWTHVALVRDHTATLYINGAAAASTSTAPNVPSGNFALGAPPQSPYSQFFTGLLDEVRVFTFATGYFSTSDLLVNSPQPTNTLGTTIFTEPPGPGQDGICLGLNPIRGGWAASTTASWITLPQASGTNSANLRFNYQANPGPTRTAAIFIGNQLVESATLVQVNVTQMGTNFVSARADVPLASLQRPVSNSITYFSGNLLIAECINSNANLFQFNPGAPASSAFTTLSGGLSAPTGHIAVVTTPFMFIFIADTGDGSIRFASVDGGPAMPVPLPGFDVNQPVGGAADSQGNYYCFDDSAHVVKSVSLVSGFFTAFSPGISTVQSISLDAEGNFYLVPSTGPTVYERLAQNGQMTGFTMMVNALSDATVNGSGNLYATGTYSNANRVVEYFPQSAEQKVLAVDTNEPYLGVAADEADNLYVVHGLAIDEIPNAYVDLTPKAESPIAGVDSANWYLPGANLPPAIAATVDQPWLNITGLNNTSIIFTYAQNYGPARTGHINLLGQSIQVTQAAFPPVMISDFLVSTNGQPTFNFTTPSPYLSPVVVTSTNVSLALSSWTSIGTVVNTGTNWNFTGPAARDSVPRFYAVRFH